MKFRFILLFVFITVFMTVMTISINAKSVELPATPEFDVAKFVYDDVGLFSQKQSASISEKLEAISSEYDICIKLITTDLPFSCVAPYCYFENVRKAWFPDTNVEDVEIKTKYVLILVGKENISIKATYDALGISYDVFWDILEKDYYSNDEASCYIKTETVLNSLSRLFKSQYTVDVDDTPVMNTKDYLKSLLIPISLGIILICAVIALFSEVFRNILDRFN